QNILVSRAGEVKVVDFGIAKAAGMSSKTQAGVIKGKINYMAPEQVMGQKADRRTDLFSVGVVIWESLTSQMVYSADNMGELVAAVRRAEIPPPSTVRPEIPPELDAIVLRALHPNTKERFQSAHQLQVELTKFLLSYAPDYSGADVAALVETVLVNKGRGQVVASDDPGEDLLNDELQDHNSLIFSAVLEAQLVVDGEEGEEVHPLGEGLTLGRAGQLAIADARASRQHARVVKRGSVYLIEDLGSSNGTFLNEQRLTAPQELQIGDSVRIGGCHLRFLAPPDQGPGGAPSVSSVPSAPVYKLVVTSGEHRLERIVDGNLPLTYQFRVGSMRLEGTSGHVILKEDGCWLEPKTSRVPITIDGEVAQRSRRLSSGDSFEIGDVSFTFAKDRR
ncbi:MAG: FHA domain-containing protein, partial [Deltaproteobacteria bacterium]|nr:FHA domain-containing protein [Deltaproteobacteria bacterium]